VAKRLGPEWQVVDDVVHQHEFAVGFGFRSGKQAFYVLLSPALWNGLTIIDVIRAAYYIWDMIVGFKSRATERLWHGERVRAFDAFAQAALRKLVMLEYAHVLSDLRASPGNQLEALSGDRKGQHSIRINRQWRVCFVWTANGADQVEIVDYH